MVDFKYSWQGNSNGENGFKDPLEIEFDLNWEDLKNFYNMFWNKAKKGFLQNALKC